MNRSRRDFLQILASGATMAAATGGTSRAFAQAAPHVVVVGGGTGGCTAAKYLKLENPALQVTVIEPNREVYRCWGSNEVVTGHSPIAEITVSHAVLQSKYGIAFIYDRVIGVDPQTQRVTLAGGGALAYDRMIVSPGIDLIYDETEGYDQTVSETNIPHAWKAGRQTLLLKAQVAAMPDNGTFILVPPPVPYRCPPGPYERASLLVEMFRVTKPRAKLLILDLKDGFTKDQPFMLGWNRLYGFNIPDSKMANMPADVVTHTAPGPLEWVAGSQGGKVERIDAAAMTVTTQAGETIKGDVINFVPPQKAAKLAYDMDLVDDRWCPVHGATMESMRHPGIHVIGDAAIAGDMPKSGYSANTQAKMVAMQINRLLTGQDLVEPMYSNVCFSRVSAEYGVSIADVYRLDRAANKITKAPDAGGVSPLDATHQINRMEAFYQAAWMANFEEDCFG